MKIIIILCGHVSLTIKYWKYLKSYIDKYKRDEKVLLYELFKLPIFYRNNSTRCYLSFSHSLSITRIHTVSLFSSKINRDNLLRPAAAYTSRHEILTFVISIPFTGSSATRAHAHTFIKAAAGCTRAKRKRRRRTKRVLIIYRDDNRAHDDLSSPGLIIAPPLAQRLMIFHSEINDKSTCGRNRVSSRASVEEEEEEIAA